MIGAGAIGAEFAGLLAELGSEVHLFEVFDQVLPGAEPEASKLLTRIFTKKGIQVHTGVTVDPPIQTPTGVTLTFAGQSVEVDVVLVAVGRAPLTAGVGLEEAGVRLDRGYVIADKRTMLTDAPGVYAVGDIVAGTPQLAHAGFAEGIAAITHIATGNVCAGRLTSDPARGIHHPRGGLRRHDRSAGEGGGVDVVVTDHGIGGAARHIKGQTQGLVKIFRAQAHYRRHRRRAAGG